VIALAAVQEKSGSPVAVLGYTGAVPFGQIFLTTWGTVIVWLLAIQDRHHALLQRAAKANTDLMDAIVAARKAGAPEGDIQAAQALHRKAQWRLDFVAAENSMGFHAPQELARIRGETIDFARQGQLAAGGATRRR
jgi:hypothetical protein